MKPIALITGASSGIGKAIAEQIADHYRLIICGRRTSRLEALSKVLSHKTEILIGSFDVRDQSAVFHFIDSLPDEWQNIFVFSPAQEYLLLVIYLIIGVNMEYGNSLILVYVRACRCFYKIHYPSGR